MWLWRDCFGRRSPTLFSHSGLSITSAPRFSWGKRLRSQSKVTPGPNTLCFPRLGISLTPSRDNTIFSKQRIYFFVCRKLSIFSIYTGSVVVEERRRRRRRRFEVGALSWAESAESFLMSTKLVQPGVNIISLAKFFKHRQKVEQLGVVHVVKPWHHGNLERQTPQIKSQRQKTTPGSSI